MRLLFAAAVLALASVLPGQYPNLRFGGRTILMPIQWNGQPAFLIATPGEQWQWVEFYDPHDPHACSNCLDVVLRPHLFGTIDGRPCLDDPVQPTFIGYGPEPSWTEPRNRVRPGVSLWTEWYEKRYGPLAYHPADSQGMGTAPWYIGHNSVTGWRTNCFHPFGVELAFLVVTVELR